MDGDERQEGPTEGLEPASESTLLKSIKRKLDGVAPMAPSRTHPDAPMQERVDEGKRSEISRKPTRDTNNNDEERTQEVCGIADADIPSVEVPDGYYLGEIDDPTQHKPTNQILHKSCSTTTISRLGDQREEHETPPTVVNGEMTCCPTPDISTRHVSTLKQVEHVSDAWEANDQHYFLMAPLGSSREQWRTAPRLWSTDRRQEVAGQDEGHRRERQHGAGDTSIFQKMEDDLNFLENGTRHQHFRK